MNKIKISNFKPCYSRKSNPNKYKTRRQIFKNKNRFTESFILKLCRKDSLKNRIEWKLKEKNKRIKLRKSRNISILRHIAYHREMRRINFKYFKMDNFGTQERYGNYEKARNKEFEKLMDLYGLIKRTIICYKMDVCDNNKEIHLFAKEDNNENNLELLKNNQEKISFRFKDIDLKMCDYIIENDLVCEAYNGQFYEQVGLTIFSNDYMTRDLYALLNY